MTKELGLNEMQQSEVKAILNAERQKVEAIFNEERKKFQLIQEETRSNLQAVLTPEQMDKLDKKMRQGQNEKIFRKNKIPIVMEAAAFYNPSFRGERCKRTKSFDGNLDHRELLLIDNYFLVSSPENNY